MDYSQVGKEQSCRWLKFGDVKGQVEMTLVAAQDRTLSTNRCKKKILKVKTDYVKNTKKTTDHVTSGCPILAKNEYIINVSICRKLDVEVSLNRYSHMPKALREQEDTTVL
jgi:hypothetical protein